MKRGDFLRLGRGELVRLDDARGRTVHVTEGSLWITQEGDVADHIVGTGDSFVVGADGATVVSALRASAFEVAGAHHAAGSHLPPRGGGRWHLLTSRRGPSRLA